MSENTEQCSNCRFWDPNSADVRGEGLCRRYAPSGGKWWHETADDDWCGEHEPKDEERTP